MTESEEILDYRDGYVHIATVCTGIKYQVLSSIGGV